MPKHSMLRAGSSKSSVRSDQLAASENFNGGFHGAFGQAGRFGYVAQARFHWPPAGPRRRSIKMKINQKCGRPLVMADQITHEDVEHVRVNGHEMSSARHATIIVYPFKRTRVSWACASYRSTALLPKVKVAAP